MILRNKIFFALLFIVTCFVNYNAYAITNCNGYSYSQCAEKTGCEWSGNSVTGRCVNSIGQVDLDVCELLTHSECNNNNCCIWISLQAAVDDYEDGECQLKPTASSNCGATSPLVTCDTNQYYNGSSCVACPSQYPESSGGVQNLITSCYRSCDGTTYYYNDGQTIPCDCLSTQQACQSSNRCIWSGASIGCRGCDVNEYLYIDPVTAEPSCHSCATDTDGERPVSPAGSVGIESCTASNCSNGYYYNTTLRNCAPCTLPTGWYAWTSAGDTDDPNSCSCSCSANYYFNNINKTCNLCSSLDNGSWTMSPDGTTASSGCYKNCTRVTLMDGSTEIGYRDPKSSTANYASNCSYKDPYCTLPGYGAGISQECRACRTQPVSTDNSDSFEWGVAGSQYWTQCPYTITCKPNHEVTISVIDSYLKLQCDPCPTGHVLESGKNSSLTAQYQNVREVVINYPRYYVDRYTITSSSDSSTQYILYYQDEVQIQQNGYTPPPTCVPGTYTITLNTNKPSGSGISISNEESRTEKIYQHYDTNWLNSADPSDVLSGTITVPRISGIDKEFNGYWTDPNNGEQVIDANGTVLKQNTYFTDDATLYAHWTNGITYELVFNDTSFPGCKTDSSCSISTFQDSCGTNFLDLTSLNNSITNKGTIENSGGTFGFTPNSTGINTIAASTPHKLTINGVSTNQCSIDATCVRCIKTECRFHLASNNYQTCAKTYFTNKTEFKDKTNQTYKLQIGDTDKARISSYAAGKIPNN